MRTTPFRPVTVPLALLATLTIGAQRSSSEGRPQAEIQTIAVSSAEMGLRKRLTQAREFGPGKDVLGSKLACLRVADEVHLTGVVRRKTPGPNGSTKVFPPALAYSQMKDEQDIYFMLEELSPIDIEKVRRTLGEALGKAVAAHGIHVELVAFARNTPDPGPESDHYKPLKELPVFPGWREGAQPVKLDGQPFWPSTPETDAKSLKRAEGLWNQIKEGGPRYEVVGALVTDCHYHCVSAPDGCSAEIHPAYAVSCKGPGCTAIHP